MKIKINSLLTFGYFSLYFIHLKIVPIDIETQPIIILIISLFLIFIKLFNKRKKPSIDKKDIWIYIFMFIFLGKMLIEITIDQNRILNILIQSLKYFIPIIVYLCYRSNINKINFEYLNLISNIYLIISIIILLKLPPLYFFLEKFYSIMLGRYLGDIYGARGISILTPEPSYFYSFFILYFLTIDYIKVNNIPINYNNLKYNKIKVLFCALLTKSGYVYGIIFIYYIFYLFYLNKIKKILVIFITIVALLLITKFNNRIEKINQSSFRIISIIKSLEIKKNDRSLIEKLCYGDASSGARFFANFLGYSVIFKYPFGIGISNFERDLPYKSKELGFDIEKQQHYSIMKKLTGEYSLGPQTYFSSLFAEVGILAFIVCIPFFRVFFIKNLIKNKELKIFYLRSYTYIFFMLFFIQGQITNPIPWILLCMIENLKMKNQVIVGEKKYGKRI